MEKKILQPGQIIVPGEYELGEEQILKIYFGVFNRRCGEIMPPAIVAHHSKGDRLKYYGASSNEAVIRNYKEKLERLISQGAEYFLLDGNHRTVAAALTHNPIFVLELQTDKDLKEINKMVESGRLYDWVHEDEDSLLKIVNAFENSASDSLKHMVTVEERVKQLVSNYDLPKYMQDIYLKK